MLQLNINWFLCCTLLLWCNKRTLCIIRPSVRQLLIKYLLCSYVVYAVHIAKHCINMTSSITDKKMSWKVLQYAELWQMVAIMRMKESKWIRVDSSLALPTNQKYMTATFQICGGHLHTHLKIPSSKRPSRLFEIYLDAEYCETRGNFSAFQRSVYDDTLSTYPPAPYQGHYIYTQIGLSIAMQ